MATWQLLLTDYSGTVLGEITQAADRVVTLPLNRVPTCTFKVPLRHYLADALMDQDVLVKGYRDQSLKFCGPVMSAEESGDALNQTIAVSAAGGAVLLGYRLIGKSKAGWSMGTASTTYDKCLIAKTAIDVIDGEFYSGITVGAVGTSSSSSAGPYWYKPVLEVIAEAASSLNGFDWEVAPVEPTNIGQPMAKIGVFNCDSVFGTTRPDAVFEYGTTAANVAEYKRASSRDKLLTKGYILAPGWPTGTSQDALPSSDATAIAARGWWEDVVPDGGVTWDTLRQQLVDEHVKVRKQARQIVTFSPAANARPAPFTDYILGDQVRARAVVNGAQRFDAMFRVWGMTFNIDNNGNEKVDLELIEPS